MTNTSALQQVADHLAGEDAARPVVVGACSPEGERVVACAGPMSLDTPIHLASVGKVYTAVLILQLVDAGVLDLDQPVIETGVLAAAEPSHLHPWYAQITLRHLLTHTSGWRDIHMDDPEHLADATSRPAPGAFMRRYARSVAALARGEEDDFAQRTWAIWDATRPADPEAGMINRFLAQGYALQPVGAPGERFHYSDTAYQLATLVLERAGGAPYHQQQRDRITTPLQLTHTAMAYGDEVDLLPISAEVYLGDQPLLALGCSLSFDMGGGGQLATIDDMLTFAHAVFAGDLLGPAGRAALFDFTSPPGMAAPRHSVGHGLQRWHTPAGRLLEGHSGAWGARMWCDRTTGWIVAGSSHRRDDGGWVDNILDIVTDHGAPQ